VSPSSVAFYKVPAAMQDVLEHVVDRTLTRQRTNTD